MDDSISFPIVSVRILISPVCPILCTLTEIFHFILFNNIDYHTVKNIIFKSNPLSLTAIKPSLTSLEMALLESKYYKAGVCLNELRMVSSNISIICATILILPVSFRRSILY